MDVKGRSKMSMMFIVSLCIFSLYIAYPRLTSQYKFKDIWLDSVFWERKNETYLLSSFSDTEFNPVGYKMATKSICNITLQKCKRYNINLAILVLTARENKIRRTSVRELWGNGHNNVFFIVGKHCLYTPDQRKPWVCEPKNSKVVIDQEYNIQQEELTRELSREPNVIIVDMIDVYRSLACKCKLGYLWVLKRTTANYILKIDDDSFARVDSVDHWLINRNDPPKYEMIAGGFNTGSPIRYGKWAETKYKRNKYPPWPSGAGHIVSRPVIEYLATHLETFVEYQGEDTTLGIWMEKIRGEIDVVRTKSKYFITHSGDCHNKEKLVIGHSISISKMKDCYKTMNEFESVHLAVSERNRSNAVTVGTQIMNNFNKTVH